MAPPNGKMGVVKPRAGRAHPGGRGLAGLTQEAEDWQASPRRPRVGRAHPGSRGLAGLTQEAEGGAALLTWLTFDSTCKPPMVSTCQSPGCTSPEAGVNLFAVPFYDAYISRSVQPDAEVCCQQPCSLCCLYCGSTSAEPRLTPADDDGMKSNILQLCSSAWICFSSILITQ